MIPELILTALFVGWILKGRFGRLADVKINYGWMIFVPVAFRLASYAANYAHVFPPSSPVFGVVHVLEFAILIVVAVANRHIPGVTLMYVGLAVNLVALLANGGYMPTSKEAVAAILSRDQLQQALSAPAVRHSFIDAGTRLKFLCDVIAAPRPFFLLPSVYSVGDLVTSLGGLIAIVSIMRNPLYSERKTLQEA